MNNSLPTIEAKGHTIEDTFNNEQSETTKTHVHSIDISNQSRL